MMFHKSLLALSAGFALASFAQVGSAAETISTNPATGMARFVRATPISAKLTARNARMLTDEARVSGAVQFLADNGKLFGIRNATTELVTSRIEKDSYGGTHITHLQVYQGVPVFAGVLKTHYDAAGNLTIANGTFVPGIDLSVTPARSAEDAKAAALKYVKADLGRTLIRLTAQATLMIYREGLAKGIPSENHLAWEVEVGNGANVREFVYVDAQSGKVIDKISGIHEAKNRRAFDGAGKTAPGPNYPGSPFWLEGQAFPTGTPEADNMIQSSAEVYDLFKNAFGRDSFDGKGARMDSIFNRGDECPNASWNGVFISFCPGTTTDDVTAHEWGHAYTEYTDKLIYAYQPGALNESYSDIWGETVDRINGRGGDTPDNARTALACTTSTNTTQLVITAPAAIAGPKEDSGTADFGPQVFYVPSNTVVIVNDGVGTASDGCETPFANAAAVVGKIAYMDRGSCSFVIKTKNAQLNGAIGVVIANNIGGGLNMTGVDDTITIPSLTMEQSDGTAIKAQTSTVTAAMQRGPGGDNSVRWLIGEEATVLGGAIRDMWNPTCYSDPGKVSDSQYICSGADAGGVHHNSGVPNHGYALLVDGGSYNGQTVTGIGLTKAAHIYFRAQSVYQTRSSGFADHADALELSCADLTGANLASLKTGAPSGEIITASDCAQVAKMALAVELRTPPSQCHFKAPLLATSPPPLCPTGAPKTLLSENFDGGKRAGVKWSVAYAGTTAEFTPRNWGVVSNLPDGRPGYGIFAVDYSGSGACYGGGNQSGVMQLDSPEVTLAADTTAPRLSFDHWFATEAGIDGGNLKISVNGGAWQLVKAADFIYNPYNTTLITADRGNTNPLAGQPAFSGSNPGLVTGSWGRSMVNLTPYAKANDKVRLRFEMGTDSCGGTYGWYLDDVALYNCTL